MQVSQNELQRKKNEADLLREKVAKLEADIQEMKQDLGPRPAARSQASDKPGQGTRSPTRGQEEEKEEAEEEKNAGHGCTESLQREVERLKQQLRLEKEARERLASSFEQERQTWNKEKGRVIKYQKQLQINYLQMHKKNQDLERLLKELTVELESRAELATDVSYISGLQTYDDVIATEIWLQPHVKKKWAEKLEVNHQVYLIQHALIFKKKKKRLFYNIVSTWWVRL